ncbi:MAD2L1-binding protein-like [Antedon mediterranea]|uniref:MAD2L1-binding protein-like n=1 Tax=Antedon mediterranea TaxID=105859 RepID=UPI003AF571B3
MAKAGFQSSQEMLIDKTCFVKFSGHVAPYIRATLVKEVMKYLLYHCHQIQMPFEQIKYDLESPKKDPNCKRPLMEVKNAKKLVANLEEIFSHIDMLFSVACVQRFAIIFGATIVSPKEVYHMTIADNSGSTGDSLRTKTCVRTLMKELITSEALLSVKKTSGKISPPTKMFLLVYAHRNSGIEWFVPINFTGPKRGEQFWIKLEHGGVNIEDDVPANIADDQDHFDNDDWIWFKAPVDVKGFLEKATNSSNIFQL